MVHIPNQDFDPIKDLPNSSVNNSRQIINNKIKKFYEQPSIWRAQELENLGFDPDLSDDGSDQFVERGEIEF